MDIVLSVLANEIVSRSISSVIAGVGAVARDSNGQVIFLAWRCFRHCGSAAEVEALAFVEGLQCAIHWRVTQVIIETDCAKIKTALNLAEATKHLLRDWRISQVKRDGNKVANALASLARRCKFSEARWGSAPASANNLLIADCNIVVPS
jgi:ribonuclease HI